MTFKGIKNKTLPIKMFMTRMVHDGFHRSRSFYDECGIIPPRSRASSSDACEDDDPTLYIFSKFTCMS